MLKKPKIKILILLITTIISGYFFVSFTIENQTFNNLKLLLSSEQKKLIKKYFFPYRVISEKEEEISQKEKEKYELYLKEKYELNFIETGSEIKTVESYVNLSNDKTLIKYNLTSGFYAGINNDFPGSDI